MVEEVAPHLGLDFSQQPEKYLYLKSVIACDPNGRLPPYILVCLRGVLPHLCVLIQAVVLNDDVKTSVLCSNVMVEAQLQV